MPPKKPAASHDVRARAEGRTYTTEELLHKATQMEAKMAQLRNRHEQFFLGLDRKPLAPDRDAMHKELDQLRQISTPNTALKFKLNTLFNRFLTYERMWMRTEKEIEEGRYKRDLFKAKLHQHQHAPSEDIDTNFDTGEHHEVAPPPRAAPPATKGPDDKRIRAIYDTLVMAKRECNESVQGMTYDSVAEKIKSQLPEIIKASGGKSVDFKVVIKDGKASLRAVTKD
jgi:hypothetical protein